MYGALDRNLKSFEEKQRRLRQEARARFLKDYTNEKKDEVLETIRFYGIKDGISHNQLAQIADLDRKSLRRYTKELKEEKLIKRDGNHGKYYPTDEAYKDPLLNASIFGDYVRSNLLNKEDDLVLCYQTITNSSLNKTIDCSNFTHYYKPGFTKKERMESSIFEFSNRLGAFITYVLIQAMNPDNMKVDLYANQMDELVIKMANNSISRMLPFLVPYCKDSIYRSMNQYPHGYEEGIKYIQRRPKFLLNKEFIDKLLNAFEKVYPRLSYEFESIWRRLPEDSDHYKKYIDRLTQKWKQQEVCKHDYNNKKPEMTLYGYFGKQCSKCHYVKKVKAPRIKKE